MLPARTPTHPHRPTPTPPQPTNQPAWVFNNIWGRWSSIARRHAATQASAAATLLGQFSGYGANAQLVNRTLDAMGVRCGGWVRVLCCG